MIYFPFITFLFFFINNILCQRNIKIDSELILCSVCNEMIENIIIQINKKKETLPYKKIDEENIQNIISNICINNKVEGEWIRRLDIIHKKSEENNNKLDITKPGGISKCQDECKTITKSCEILFDDFIDPDDLSALLYKNKLSIKETQVYYLFIYYYFIITIYHYLFICLFIIIVRKKFVVNGQINVTRNKKVYLIQELMNYLK